MEDALTFGSGYHPGLPLYHEIWILQMLVHWLRKSNVILKEMQ